MKLFQTLNEDVFTLFAARHYYNPTCIDAEEFHEDLKRFKYVKRLLNRYCDNGKLSEKLIFNLVIIFNVFGIEAGLKMLEYKISEEQWGIIKPFLIYLKITPSDKYMLIPSDPIVVDILRKF